MNLYDTLAAGMLKKDCTRVVNWVGSDRARFEELFSLFTGPDETVARRASWPLSYVARRHPALFRSKWATLLKRLDDPVAHDSIKRHTLVMFEQIDIPIRFQGRLMTSCFDLLLSPREKPAVKVFSLAVLRKLAKRYPEILPELNTLIHTQWEHESKAFRASAKGVWFFNSSARKIAIAPNEKFSPWI